MFYRQNFQELDKSTQDSAMLLYIQAHRRLPELKEVCGRDTAHGKSRLSTSDPTQYRQGIGYYFSDIKVCRSFFFFIHDIGLRRFTNLMHHFDTYGTLQRVHKSTGKTPNRKTVLSVANIENIVHFIREYATKHAIPLPGRMAKFKNYKVVLLPASKNKRVVHSEYQESLKIVAEEEVKQAGCSTAAGAVPLKSVAYKTFAKLWLKYVPFIVTSKPASDLYSTCCDLTRKIVRAMRRGEEARKHAVGNLQFHLADAAKQRAYYNEWRMKAKTKTTCQLHDDDIEESSFEVLSFDFADRVSYPSSARPTGSEYFESPCRCDIFGVHNERSRMQTNYLIDEANSIGKGANVIVSMLHNYLQNVKADYLVLFANGRPICGMEC